MIESIAVLLLLQLLGELFVQLSGAPIPGPVVGMLFLALMLCAQGQVSEPLRKTCLDLLSHLSLLFVPAGVGVMLYLDRIATEWLPLITAIVLSTWLTLVVTASVMQWAMRRQSKHAVISKHQRTSIERISHHE